MSSVVRGEIDLIYSQALFDSVDTASSLDSDSNHPGHGTKCRMRRNRLPVECPDRDLNPRPLDS